MHIIPKTIWWHFKNDSTEPISIEPTSVGGGAVDVFHTIVEPLLEPADDAKGEYQSNEPRSGFEVLAVNNNKAYWKSPDGYVFEISAVMTAKVLRFGDVSTLRLSIVFDDGGAVKGLILEEHLELVKKNCILWDDAVPLANAGLALTPGTEVWIPVKEQYCSKPIGKVMYLGQLESGSLLFYRRAPNRLYQYDIGSKAFVLEHANAKQGHLQYVNLLAFALEIAQRKTVSQDWTGPRFAFKLKTSDSFALVAGMLKYIQTHPGASGSGRGLLKTLSDITNKTDPHEAVADFFNLLKELNIYHDYRGSGGDWDHSGVVKLASTRSGVKITLIGIQLPSAFTDKWMHLPCCSFVTTDYYEFFLSLRKSSQVLELLTELDSVIR